jgi:quercetin 2,3-dioxygenase
VSDPVIQTVELGASPWPTIDPFLFCVHHRDAYPPGDERMAPQAALDGRDLGMDFSGRDGWSMYHGLVVPGFPQHPHRGFETVTYVRRGYVDHSDSLGATARFGRGDVQWLTAGGGIVHAEMFPLVEAEADNPTELFQIWLNLPGEDKLVDPHFSMLWDEDIPRVVATDADGRSVEITVVAGALAGEQPAPPPPRSWASRSDTDVAIWHLRFEPGSAWVLPPAGPQTVRMLYVFEGGGLDVAGHVLGARTGAAIEAGEPVELTAGDEPIEALILQGRPIGEPVAQYGPFVLNDKAGIEQAFADYRRTGFGGWPFPDDAPTHARTDGRFAKHADGRVEHAPASATAV